MSDEEGVTDFAARADASIVTSDGPPYLFVKEEPSTTIVVPAEDRTIRVPRGS